MANSNLHRPLDPFKSGGFDIISGNIEGKNTMKGIEEVVEESRKDIFDILSSGRANGNVDTDKNSLEKMSRVLKGKKDKLEENLGEVDTDFDISEDNSDLLAMCKNILDSVRVKIPANVDSAMGNRCGKLLSRLYNVYNIGGRTDHLFSGRKKPADQKYADLIQADKFKNIINSSNESELESNLQAFIDVIYNKYDNSFAITRSSLYSKQQAEIAGRIAIFLHCMQKAFNEGRISKDPTDPTRINIMNILKKLEEVQIPKIRGIYNLKKEKEAVDAEYNTLVDIMKNDKDPITRADTSINLTDSFEGKSEKEAKDIDFYNLDKKNIKVTIGTTTIDNDKIVLEDSSLAPQDSLDKPRHSLGSSGDYTLSIMKDGNKIKLGTLCIDYKGDPAQFILKADPNVIDNLDANGLNGDINLEIPIMAVKNVDKPRTTTGQVSLTRVIKAKFGTSGGGGGGSVGDDVEDVVASLSNVTEVSREEAERVAEEQLRKRYEDLPRYSLDRINLFFRREYIKEGEVRKIMDKQKGLSRKDRDTSATDRQQLQIQNSKIFDDEIQTEDMATKFPATYNEIDRLCQRYMGVTPPPLTETEFKEKFDEAIRSNKDLLKYLGKERALTYSSNILFRIKMFVAHQKMVDNISNYLTATPSHTDEQIDAYCRNEIKTFMDSYNELPRFLKDAGLALDNPNFVTNLKGSTAALTNIAARTMKLKMEIIKKGSAAYQIKQKRGGIAGIGDFFNGSRKEWRDNHSLLTLEATGLLKGALGTASIMGAGVLGGTLFGPLGLAIASGTAVGLRALFSKYSDYTREHEGQMKNEAVDLANYKRERARLESAVGGKKWYEINRLWGKNRHDARHWFRYVNTTHGQSKNIAELTREIRDLANKGEKLSNMEEDNLKYFVGEGFARLSYYKQTGQNFLGSDDVKNAELEYRDLYASLISGAKRLNWVDGSDPDKLDVAQIESNNGYQDTMTAIKKAYNEAHGKFKSKRRKLGRGWGFFVTGAIAGGLSYLTTRLHTKKQVVGSGDEHNFKVPGDHDSGSYTPGSTPAFTKNPNIVDHEVSGGSRSLYEVFKDAMADPANADASGYDLIVSPEVDSIPVSTSSTTHTYATLYSKVSSIGSTIADPETKAAFDKAMALHPTMPPRYKRSALEKAIAYAGDNGANVGNQYLFGERFAESVKDALVARDAAGTNNIPIDKILFGKSAANAAASVTGSTGAQTERSINAVLKIKTPWTGFGVPISRNTFKRHEGNVDPA